MLSGIVTVSAFIGFLLVLIWALLPANQQRFDEAAQLPLKDTLEPLQTERRP